MRDGGDEAEGCCANLDDVAGEPGHGWLRALEPERLVSRPGSTLAMYGFGQATSPLFSPFPHS